ncbi:MAG: TPM domain-containing protein [Chloroflexota bacterium]
MEKLARSGLRDRDARSTWIAAAVSALLLVFALPLAVLAADPPPPGPPFPDPVADQAVYDFAGVFSPATIATAEATIDEIEARTGAEIAVYTQNVHVKPSTEETNDRARALIDQWGVGRRGFDDGLVIFFDLDDSLVHGQVQLYAGAGYEAAFLSRSERQALFDDEMLPLLLNEDLDGALLVALARIDANATPGHASTLQVARQIDAAVGLIGAPVVLFLLIGWAWLNWWKYGRDPVYLDDASILMPAPPAELSAASAVFILEGGPSRRALTTALLDLASRGVLAFRKVDEAFAPDKVAIDIDPVALDDVTRAQRARNNRRPLSPAEVFAEESLRGIADPSGTIDPAKLLEFGAKVADFDKKLERHTVERRWLAAAPSRVTQQWALRGFLAIGVGIALLVIGGNLPSQGVALVGVAALIGGVVVLAFARVMPAVTMPGAMIRAMLAAFRRTLHRTMEQSRSMDQVVAGSGLSWLETPDQAVVWGTALGLHEEIERVLKRSLEDVERGVATATSTYLPTWYHGSDGQPFSSSAGASGGGGLFSSSAVPNIGGMMASLGSIGNSPSSSGGGGGGFSGGGGGGGGGSGGGF